MMYFPVLNVWIIEESSITPNDRFKGDVCECEFVFQSGVEKAPEVDIRCGNVLEYRLVNRGDLVGWINAVCWHHQENLIVAIECNVFDQ